MIRRALLAAAVAGLGLSATQAVAAPRSFEVVIDKMKFGSMPTQARKGDTIVWVNRDIFRHTATAKNRSFDVDLQPGARAKTVLTSAGSIPIVCKYHPGMRALLKVSAR